MMNQINISKNSKENRGVSLGYLQVKYVSTYLQRYQRLIFDITGRG